MLTNISLSLIQFRSFVTERLGLLGEVPTELPPEPFLKGVGICWILKGLGIYYFASDWQVTKKIQPRQKTARLISDVR